MLCDNREAQSFSKPQFPCGLGLLLLASWLQQVPECMGLWCCGMRVLGRLQTPSLPPQTPPTPGEVAAPLFSQLVS